MTQAHRARSAPTRTASVSPCSTRLTRQTPQDDQRALQLLRHRREEQSRRRRRSSSSPRCCRSQVAERVRAVRDEQREGEAALQKLEALRAMERSLLRDRVRSGGGGGGGGGGRRRWRRRAADIAMNHERHPAGRRRPRSAAADQPAADVGRLSRAHGRQRRDGARGARRGAARGRHHRPADARHRRHAAVRGDPPRSIRRCR